MSACQHLLSQQVILPRSHQAAALWRRVLSHNHQWKTHIWPKLQLWEWIKILTSVLIILTYCLIIFIFHNIRCISLCLSVVEKGFCAQWWCGYVSRGFPREYQQNISRISAEYQQNISRITYRCLCEVQEGRRRTWARRLFSPSDPSGTGFHHNTS